MMTTLIASIPALLLIGTLGAMPTGKFIHARAAEILSCVSVSLSALVACGLLAFLATTSWEGATVPLFPFILAGDFSAFWSLRLDALSAVMLVVVCGVSALVHIYSVGYMHADRHRPRFFAYLSFFTLMMVMLVMSDNFLQLFFGWEGVGLASYLLIGFWHRRAAANAAAIKAFIVNRVGDAAFLLGLAALVLVFGTLDYDTIFKAAPALADAAFLLPFGLSVGTLDLIACLLLIGAMGKSAQILLHVWLPDAMEGPTPVSALIHAATMVTAGVFMIARAAPLYNLTPDVLALTAIVGGTTAIFAASIGLVQNDIKRVIAYSTCSQLGYMFAALGLGAYHAAIFHLFTHAFFKALLFLGAGSVIHALADEQDMRKMGGLAKRMRASWAMMLIGVLSLTGFPLTAGYVSKDAIIETAWASTSALGPFVFWTTLAAAFLTAFYSWRLFFMTFHGESRASADVEEHAHESPPVMLVPLGVLALGALVAGVAFAPLFLGGAQAGFWGDTFGMPLDEAASGQAHVPLLIFIAPFVAALLGFGLAFWAYITRPGALDNTARRHVLIYRLFVNKWFFDELYAMCVVRPTLALSRFLWKRGDEGIIDAFGPDGLSAGINRLTRRAVRLQSGYVYHYAFAMLLGLTLFVSWAIWGGALLQGGAP